jgi:hypothetical protein
MRQFGVNSEYYSALVADLVGSRSLETRAAVQEVLGSILERVNREQADALAAPLVFSRGDEVQGLFHMPARILGIVTEISESLFPAEIRFGIGYGTLSTGLSEDPNRIDGPCFHMAREALDKKHWVRVSGFSPVGDTIINGLFALLQSVRARWTERQVAFIRSARSAETRREVADQLQISPSVVTESLQAAFFREVLEGEDALVRAIAHFSTFTESVDHSPESPNMNEIRA